MPAVIDDKFQGFCVVADDSGYIDVYDEFPPATREALREAPFNICPMCFGIARDYAGDYSAAKDRVLVAEFCQFIQGVLDGRIDVVDCNPTEWVARRVLLRFGH